MRFVADAVLAAGLARLSAPACGGPELRTWLDRLYRGLLQVAAGQALPWARAPVATRMRPEHGPAATVAAPVPAPGLRVVVANVLRAGTIPSLACFDELDRLGCDVRLDYVMAGRRKGPGGEVVDTDITASKVGGSVEGAVLLVPDPLGSTGSTMDRVLGMYEAFGRPRATLALHLLVTPEYLRRMRDRRPGTVVYALRLDRGLSPPDVLARSPGEQWARERGVDDHGYIVPGLGDLGDLLNRAGSP